MSLTKASQLLFWLSLYVGPAVNAETVCESFFKSRGFQTVAFNSTERRFHLASNYARLMHSRTAKQQLLNDSILSHRHSLLEMNFQVKNPETGFYDKFQKVPVNSRPAILSTQAFESLVASMEPVLVRLRELLQKIYSGAPMTQVGLGLQALPVADADFFIKVIKQSLYLEPRFISPNMRDYPFIGVAGFDGAIGDPDHPEAKFFEMNLGTPSGLSNNILLLENLLKVDQALADQVAGHLPMDRTFENLKQVIDDNALAWTKRQNGISVVISPGIYNGAHADVAEIAKRSGMPLVKLSDMYMDSRGHLRLYLGKKAKDPFVTGIYGRMEESFFFQSSKDNIAMISPNFEESNKLLAKKIGINLKPGAIYKFIYDENNKITDVERDSNGQPLLQDVWDKLLDNPYTGAKSGPLYKALIRRKFYYSAIGGRIVDDKRLFHLLTKYLVQSDGPIAQPVSSLSYDEFDKLYNKPENYVVKEPANSGGVGVHFLSQMTAEKQKALLDKVKKNPRAYEVQEFRSPNTLSYVGNLKTGVVLDEVATDLRIFAFLDSHGKVHSGPNAALLRTGASGSFFSNTSQGGGYGVLMVLNPQASYARQVSNQGHSPLMSLPRQKTLRSLLQKLAKIKVSELDAQKSVALSFELRNFLEFIPYKQRRIMTDLRGYSEGRTGPSVNLQDEIKQVSQSLSYFLTE